MDNGWESRGGRTYQELHTSEEMVVTGTSMVQGQSVMVRVVGYGAEHSLAWLFSLFSSQNNRREL